MMKIERDEGWDEIGKEKKKENMKKKRKNKTSNNEEEEEEEKGEERLGTSLTEFRHQTRSGDLLAYLSLNCPSTSSAILFHFSRNSTRL